MRRTIFTLFLSLIATATISAASDIKVFGDSAAISITSAGELSRTMIKTDISAIKRLSISGRLNSVDLRFLHDNEDLNANIVVLNMLDADLATDECAYATETYGSDCVFQVITYYLSKEDEIVHTRTENTLIGWQYSYYNYYSHDFSAVFRGQKLKRLYLPRNLKTIGANTTRTPELETIVMPEGITKVKEGAFKGNSKLASFINLDKANLTEVEDGAFSSTKLKKIDLSNVTRIGSSAFSSTDIADADLSKVDTIPSMAFAFCKKLSNIKLNDKLSFIGTSAFEGCALQNVTAANSLTFVSGDSFDGTKFIDSQIAKNGVAYIGNFALKISPSASMSTLRIKDGITHIATHASAISSSHGNLTIELPATLKYIGDYAFSETKCLTKCDIPNGVEHIGTYAFYKSGLREVTLPASVKYVGYSCFEGNSSLLKVNYGVTGQAQINSRLFNECSALIELNIGANVEDIPSGTFRGCSSLSEVNFAKRDPNLPLHIGTSAFGKCSSLQRIALPEATDSIEENAFWLSGIKSFRLPTGIRYLGPAVFYEAGKDTLYIPDGKGKVNASSYPFQRSSFKTIIYNAKALDAYALLSYLSTDTVIIGRNVERLPESLFYNSQIGHIAFENRPDNKPLYINSSAMLCMTTSYLRLPEFISYFDGTIGAADTIEYRLTNMENCSLMSISKLKHIIIGKNVELLGDQFASYCSSLETVAFEDRDRTTPLKIGEGAFSYCKNIKNIPLPEGTTTIDEWAFRETNLDTINFPSTLTAMAGYAFYKASIKKMTLAPRPDGTPLNIDDEAFYETQMPDSIVFPEGLSEIAQVAFYYSKGLKYIYLPASITKIGDCAFGKYLEKVEFAKREASTPLELGAGLFQDCEKLDSIFLPDAVEAISEQLFANSGIRSINIGANINSIGRAAFYGCPNLTNLTFRNRDGKALEIGEYSFCGATLDSLNLPEGVSEIGGYAFNSASINNVTFPSSLKKVGERAFMECQGLKDIEIPAGMQLGELAFAQSSLEKVVLNKSQHDYCSFLRCPNLKTVCLRNGAGRLLGQFSQCSIDTLYNYEETPARLYDDATSYEYGIRGGQTILYVLPQSVESYKKTSVWERCDVRPMNDDQIAAGIKSVTDGDASDDNSFEIGDNTDIYSMDGIKKTSMTKGTYILRNKYGKTRKILKK